MITAYVCPVPVSKMTVPPAQKVRTIQKLASQFCLHRDGV